MPKVRQPTSAEGNVLVGQTAQVSSPVGLLPLHTVTIRQAQIPEERRPEIIVKAHLPESLNLDTTSTYETPFADGFLPNDGMFGKLKAFAQIAGFSPITQSMTTQFWQGSSPIQITLPLTLVAWNAGDEITRTVLLLKAMQMPRIEKTTRILRAPGPLLRPSEKFLEGADKLQDVLSGVMKDGLEGLQSMAGRAVDATKSAFGEDNSEAEKGTTQDANMAESSIMQSMSQTLSTMASHLQGITNTIESMFTVEGKISITIGDFLHFDDVQIEHVSDAYQIVLGPDGKPHKCEVTIQAVTRMTPTYEDLVNTNGKRGIYMYPDVLQPQSKIPSATRSIDSVLQKFK